MFDLYIYSSISAPVLFKKPTPNQINLIKNANNFLLVKKFKNTESAQLWPVYMISGCNLPCPDRFIWPRGDERREEIGRCWDFVRLATFLPGWRKFCWCLLCYWQALLKLKDKPAHNFYNLNDFNYTLNVNVNYIKRFSFTKMLWIYYVSCHGV